MFYFKYTYSQYIIRQLGFIEMLNLKAVLLIRITRQVEGTPNTLKNHEKILLIVFLTKI